MYITSKLKNYIFYSKYSQIDVCIFKMFYVLVLLFLKKKRARTFSKKDGRVGKQGENLLPYPHQRINYSKNN